MRFAFLAVGLLLFFAWMGAFVARIGVAMIAMAMPVDAAKRVDRMGSSRVGRLGRG